MPRGWSGGALSWQRRVKPNKRLSCGPPPSFAHHVSQPTVPRRELQIGRRTDVTDVITEPRATLSRPSISAGALILTTPLLRNLCLTNRMRPSWHGSRQFLGGAPVLSSFGTRETKTAAPMIRTTRSRRGPHASRRAGPATGNFPKLRGIKMRTSKKPAASLLGAAAVAGLMSASAAQAAPAGRVTLSDGNLINVIQRGDYGQYDLHAYPAGPGWVGKGAVSPHAGYRHHR
jgi:hypothetical protein